MWYSARQAVVILHNPRFGVWDRVLIAMTSILGVVVGEGRDGTAVIRLQYGYGVREGVFEVS